VLAIDYSLPVELAEQSFTLSQKRPTIEAHNTATDRELAAVPVSENGQSYSDGGTRKNGVLVEALELEPHSHGTAPENLETTSEITGATAAGTAFQRHWQPACKLLSQDPYPAVAVD
jgi:hypothetical protein